MTIKQLEAKIDVLETQIRELKAAQDTRGHCFGCMCGNVTYYPAAPGATAPVYWPMFNTGTVTGTAPVPGPA